MSKDGSTSLPSSDFRFGVHLIPHLWNDHKLVTELQPVTTLMEFTTNCTLAFATLPLPDEQRRVMPPFWDAFINLQVRHETTVQLAADGICRVTPLPILSSDQL